MTRIAMTHPITIPAIAPPESEVLPVLELVVSANSVLVGLAN